MLHFNVPNWTVFCRRIKIFLLPKEIFHFNRKKMFTAVAALSGIWLCIPMCTFGWINGQRTLIIQQWKYFEKLSSLDMKDCSFFLYLFNKLNFSLEFSSLLGHQNCLDFLITKFTNFMLISKIFSINSNWNHIEIHMRSTWLDVAEKNSLKTIFFYEIPLTHDATKWNENIVEISMNFWII